MVELHRIGALSNWCYGVTIMIVSRMGNHLHGDGDLPVTGRHRAPPRRPAGLAVGETVILLHPPLPLVGVSIWTERGRQQRDSLADGLGEPSASRVSKICVKVARDHQDRHRGHG